LAAAASALFLGSALSSHAATGCPEPGDIAVLSAPMTPWKGAPLRVLFTSERPLDGELSLVGPDGSIAARSHERHGGPPYFWSAEVASPRAGMWRVTLQSKTAGDCAPISRDIAVRDSEPAKPGPSAGSVWPVHQSWNRATENLYSAWIEKLFDAPLNEEPSWPALDKVIKDKSRNVLFNYLGLREDDALVMKPDCADMPYFLRAYFAFKMGLPFGYANCSRGGNTVPKCYNFQTMLNGSAGQQGLAQSFAQYLKVVGDGVQSGNGRTAANDDNTDFYPVALKQETLRPGTIYADPYGHVLMLVRRVPQAGGAAGVFLASDAEPDGTVSRKRFWRGTFLFTHNPAIGGPGFKRFRPIVRDDSGNFRRLSNAEIARNPNYADFSLEQAKLASDEFYDRMDDVMSPAPLDPVRAMKEAMTSLEEQIRTRVTAIELGRKFQNSGKGEASMPDGAAIFATTGAWEDFSTPARDFRLLIAIDVVRGFPDRVARRPERYAMPAGKSVAEVKAEMENVLASELAARKFTYTRSDGSAWTLSLKDVIARSGEFEMAYNPNDCVELRWGAGENSEEAATCKRHAAQTQRSKMIKYRTWFRGRQWPVGA
jgi:hypothetical protein